MDPASHDEHAVRLPTTVFAELRRSLSEVAGAEPADEVLFRVGRTWGESEGRRVAASGEDPEACLRRSLERLEQRGLGRILIHDLELSGSEKDRRLVVSVHGSAAEETDVANCGMTIGYLTGFAGALLDLDLVCTPFRCSGSCGSTGCSFEIRPAHTWRHQDEHRPPGGSTRFFLPTLGPALSGSDISLNDIVEHSGDAIIFIDKEDVIRFWNRGAELTFGYDRDEVVGRRVGFLLPGDLLEQDELGWIRTRIEVDGMLSNHITRRVCKDGTELAVSLTRTLLHDSAGETVGSTAVLRDVTEQAHAEEELRRTRELALIGELAATVAHEIKNPLAGIYAAIQLLQRNLGPDDERRTVFEDIGLEIRRLDRTVQELLVFTRPLSPRLVRTELAAFVHEILASPGIASATAEHSLSVQIPEGLDVPVDIGLMASVIQNLVLNAAQATDSGGSIRIVAAVEPCAWTLTVSDTGPGIPAELRDSVFQPFFTTRSRGSGLGLSIARKNVEAHGGTLRAAAHGGTLQAASQTGPGASLTLEVPLLEPADEARA